MTKLYPLLRRIIKDTNYRHWDLTMAQKTKKPSISHFSNKMTSQHWLKISSWDDFNFRDGYTYSCSDCKFLVASCVVVIFSRSFDFLQLHNMWCKLCNYRAIICKWFIFAKTFYTNATLQIYTVELQWKLGHVEKVYTALYKYLPYALQCTNVDVTVNYCESVLHLFHCTWSSN